MQAIGWDTETHLICAENPIPRMVCVAMDTCRSDLHAVPGAATGVTSLSSNADSDCLHRLLSMWQSAYDASAFLDGHNAPYDIAVVLRYASDVIDGQQPGQPGTAKDLFHLVWEALDASMEREWSGGQANVRCTMLREKLWTLSTLGCVERGKVGYGLDDLVRQRLGVDISEGKVELKNGKVVDADGRDITGTPKAASVWRLRYSVLDGVPAVDWPQEARDYAIADATWARRLALSQSEGSAVPGMGSTATSLYGFGSMRSESLQVYAGVALLMYAVPGFSLDAERVGKLRQTVSEAMIKYDQTLRNNGIVRPNGSVDTKVLKARVAQACALVDKHPALTDGGDIATGDEVLEELAGLDPVLDLYRERQGFKKLDTAFLPQLQTGHVWTHYDTLKETGRTSSKGAGRGSGLSQAYPAVNIQQVPRAAGARECFVPPKGMVLMSADYEGVELASVAQVTWDLFGHSVHRERINEGKNLHSWLAASMAMALAPHLVNHEVASEPAYAAFEALRKRKVDEYDGDKHCQQDQRDIEYLTTLKDEAKQYRSFAKPTGLGYPGGLGPSTFRSFAKATYGVDVTLDQAHQFRDLWRVTYPEMPEYFRWLEKQKDQQNGGGLYAYETQGFGRYRAACTFCAAANGKAMQSLTSDGAKRSVAWIARACFGGLRPSNAYALLEGCVPQAFIHDENLVAIPDDILSTERSLLVCQLMIEAMSMHMPDVQIRCEPAQMRRWTKAAEPEWRRDDTRPARVCAALDAWGDSRGVARFADILADALPGYDPARYLVPYDDAHKV